jgi:hypothetical protein
MRIHGTIYIIAFKKLSDFKQWTTEREREREREREGGVRVSQ